MRRNTRMGTSPDYRARALHDVRHTTFGLEIASFSRTGTVCPPSTVTTSSYLCRGAAVLPPATSEKKCPVYDGN
jgi:hypothetical protein